MFKMFKFYLNKKILLGFFVTLATLSWLAVYSYLNAQRMISSSRWVAHTFDVLYNAERVVAMSVNLEIGQRGYSLTGNKKFLEAYKAAQAEIHKPLNSLVKLTRDNAGQQQR